MACLDLHNVCPRAQTDNKKKGDEMKVTNHWNDKFYESTECELCGKFEMEKSIVELQVAIDNHSC